MSNACTPASTSEPKGASDRQTTFERNLHPDATTATTTTAGGNPLSQALGFLSAALRIGWAVSEGAGEGVLNMAINAAEMLPPAVRQAKEPYPMDLTGKVAIVTGGNAGIGFATARQLARRGAHVILACRDRARAEAAVQAIRREAPLPGCCGMPRHPALPPSSCSPSPPLQVEAMELDLGRLASVRQFADQWAARGLPLNLLVCNAGVMAPLTRTLTPDGFEVQFQVNFLSHWLLTHLLLDRERDRRRKAQQGAGAGAKAPGSGAGGAADPPADSTRVVIVSSVVHRVGPLQWHDLLSEKSYEPYITYGGSKLATVVFAKELQRRMDRHPEYSLHDSAVSIHPGIVRTYLANNFFRSYALSSLMGTPLEPLAHLWRKFVDTGFQSMMIPVHVAADRMLHACLGPREQLAGQYLALGRVCCADKTSNDPSYAAQLWDTATRLTRYAPGPSLA